MEAILSIKKKRRTKFKVSYIKHQFKALWSSYKVAFSFEKNKTEEIKIAGL